MTDSVGDTGTVSPFPPGEREAIAAQTVSDTAVSLICTIGEPTPPNETAAVRPEAAFGATCPVPRPPRANPKEHAQFSVTGVQVLSGS